MWLLDFNTAIWLANSRSVKIVQPSLGHQNNHKNKFNQKNYYNKESKYCQIRDNKVDANHSISRIEFHMLKIKRIDSITTLTDYITYLGIRHCRYIIKKIPIRNCTNIITKTSQNKLSRNKKIKLYMDMLYMHNSISFVLFKKFRDYFMVKKTWAHLKVICSCIVLLMCHPGVLQKTP